MVSINLPALKSPYDVIVMQNPSIADSVHDDPTVRKLYALMGCEKRLPYYDAIMCSSSDIDSCGCNGPAYRYVLFRGGFVVVNLYAFIATDPSDLHEHQSAGYDVVGVDNDTYIEKVVQYGARRVVVAWGADKRCRVRAINTLTLLQKHTDVVYCFGTNKDNSPKHPLYLKNTTEIVPYLYNKEKVRFFYDALWRKSSAEQAKNFLLRSEAFV